MSTAPTNSPTGGTTPSPSPTPSPTPTSPTPTPPQSTPPQTNPPQTNPPVVTSSIIAPTPDPTTQVVTSVVTPPTRSTQRTSQPTTVVVTRTSQSTVATDPNQTFPPGSPTSTSTAISAGQAKGSKGLTAGGKTAIAVIIPIFVVALLILGGIFLWRRRRQTKEDEEERRKEVEAYGYNPNHDPTLPVIGAPYNGHNGDGYRGWGSTGPVGRQPSNSASAGMTQGSDGYQPGSPTQGTTGTFNSDQHSTDPLMNGRRELDAEPVGNLGAGPVAPSAFGAGSGLRRGPSNASSTYSTGEHNTAQVPDVPVPQYNGNQVYYDNAYYQPGPYDNGYGTGQQAIIRDNPARRNTQIQHANFHPHQGGISQNF